MAPLTKEKVLEKLKEYNEMPPEKRVGVGPFKDVEIGDVDFLGREFVGYVDFSGAQFTGKAHFMGAQFSEMANFAGAQFAQKANFGKTIFIKGANFFGANFTEVADFAEAQFTEWTHFAGAHFNKEVNFLRTHFETVADFIGTQFIGGAEFSVAQLKQGTFSGAQFFQEVNFNETQFTGDAIFMDAEFNKWADFAGANFTQNANFWKVKFTQGANFWRTHFAQSANFADTQFTQKADFWKARFEQGADFSGAQFIQEADFHEAQFLGMATFKGHDEIKEENIAIPKNYIFERDADFSNIIVGPENLFFKKVNLSKCTFFDTDLTKIDFTDVQWLEKMLMPKVQIIIVKLLQMLLSNTPQILLNKLSKELFEKWDRESKEFKESIIILGKRNSLDDEENADYSIAEKLYRQLKLSYENKGNYPDAGDFYYGEMEMRRKQLPNWLRRNILSFISWYKYLSGYGENYILSFIWLVLILLGFAIGYSFLDFEAIDGIKAVFNFDHSLMYSLKVMTFQRHALSFKPITTLGKNLTAIQSILGPLQIALFALALRRRFKR